MKPNEGIYQDGLEAAFLHGASPIDNDYGTMAASPHLHFQRWSWLLGYAEGLRMRIEKQQLEASQGNHRHIGGGIFGA